MTSLSARWWILLGLLVVSTLVLRSYIGNESVAAVHTAASKSEKTQASGSGPTITFRIRESDDAVDAPPVSVRVTDSEGIAIEGALVCTQPASSGPFRATTSSCQSTGRDGNVTFSPAPAKTTRVLASAAEFSAQERIVQGPDTAVFALRRAPAVVSGEVEDANGGPVAGALVLALSALEADTVVGATHTDDRGAFTVSTGPGDLRLRVVAHGFAAWQRGAVAPSSDVRVVMAQSASILGRVEDAATGRPIEGAIVQARRHDVYTGSFGQATTAADGSFTIFDLGPGMHLVRLLDEHWAAEMLEVRVELGASAEVEFAAKQAGAVELTLTAGGRACPRGLLSLLGPSAGSGMADERGIVRVSGLEPGDYVARPSCPGALPAESRTLKVRQSETLRETWDLEVGMGIDGRVVGGSSSEVEGLTVRAFDVQTGRGTDCVSGDHGAFSCGGLVAGQYQCSVILQDTALSDVAEVRVDAGIGGQGVVLTLLPAGRVAVTLTDEAKRPLDHVQVSLKAPGKVALLGVALGGGRYDFRRIPAGSYVATVDGEQASEQAQRVQVAPGKTSEVLWALPARDVVGWVVDATGAPQSDTWVSLWGVESSRGASPEAEAMTDAEGRFILPRLVRSAYAIRIDGPWGNATRSFVEARSPLLLTLPSPARSPGTEAGAAEDPGPSAESGPAAVGEAEFESEAASAAGFGPESAGQH